MSNIKELIRAEIERLKQQAEESKMEWVNEGYNQNAFAEDCRISSFDKLLSFLDTLPDESEQPTKGYDEAYLNEKIAKASKSWEGVDVDKFMDEIRGREPVSDCHDLEEAADDHIRKVVDAAGHPGWDWETQDIADAFKAGAEWQKAKMMEEAVEGEVCILPGHVAYVKEKNNESLKRYLIDNFKAGDKVKIIIVKEGEQ